MQRALHLVGALACVAALVLLSFLSFLAYRAIPIERSIQNDADEAHRVLLEAGLTAMTARQASADEERYLKQQLPVITTQTERTLADADVLLRNLQGTSTALGDTARSATGVLDATRTTVADIAPILQQTHETLVGLQPLEVGAAQTLADADTLVKDPDIAASLRNVNEGTAQIAATAKDVREEVHAITHPKPLTQIIDWVLKIGQAAGSWAGGIL